MTATIEDLPNLSKACKMLLLHQHQQNAHFLFFLTVLMIDKHPHYKKHYLITENNFGVINNSFLVDHGIIRGFGGIISGLGGIIATFLRIN